MTRLNKLIAVFCITILAIGCSKDDNSGSNEPTTIEGGVIFTSQLVKIELGENIPQEEYTGNFNDNTIDLAKLGEQTLGFFVTDNFALGDAVLDIPDFNTTVNYTVQETVLEKPVDEVVADMEEKFEVFGENYPFGDSQHDIQAQEALNHFLEGVEQLSESEREDMAVFYQSNKQLIDELMAPNHYVSILENARMAGPVDDLIAAMGPRRLAAATALSIISMGQSVHGGLLAIKAGQPQVAVAFGAIAAVSFATTLTLGEELVSRAMKVVDFSFDGILAAIANAKTSSSPVEFTTGVEKTLSFELSSRSINPGDSDDGSDVLSDIFGALSKLNGLIDSTNEVITWISDNTWFSFSTIDNIDIQESSASFSSMNQEEFDNINFSLSHENLTLSSVSFTNGNIEIQIDVNDPDDVDGDFIESTLDFEYEDDTNHINGSFPIKVFSEDVSIDLTGNWIMQVSGTELFGTFDDEPALYRFVFNEGSNTITFNQVTIISDGYQEDGSALNSAFGDNTYVIDGQQLSVVFSTNGTMTPSCYNEQTEEWDDYYRDFTMDVDINTTYDAALDSFVGTVHEVVDFEEVVIPCENSQDSDLNGSIEIYRE